jgi:hypothetical protein
MSQLSPHFTLEEMLFSRDATIFNIDNSPTPEIVANLTLICAGMEKVRELLGNLPIHIDSGYRCEQLNVVVGGVPNSAHLSGYAADFICAAFGAPLDIVQAIAASDLKYDQLIQEGGWVHLSVSPTMRQEILTAHFIGGVAHRAVYHKGIF